MREAPWSFTANNRNPITETYRCAWSESFFVAFVFLSSIALTAWLALRGPRFDPFARLTLVEVPLAVSITASVVLPLTFWLQVRLAAIEAAHDSLRDAFTATLPIAIAFDFHVWRLLSWLTVPFATFGCIALGTGALLALCLTPPRAMGARLALVGCGFTLAALAVSSPVLTSSDVYMYVFAGDHSHTAYAPPRDLFGPASVLMDRRIPLRGAIYGPLWVAANAIVVSSAHTVAGKIVALRLFNVLLLLAAACAIRLAGASDRAQIAFVLNPMLWFYSVLNAHNDILALVPCLIAICLVRRSVVAAALLVALAGCIKLPFLVVGLVVFGAAERTYRWRTFGVLFAVATCLAASWAFGGPPYLRDLLGFAHQRSALGNAQLNVFGLSTTITALGFLAYALGTQRFLRYAALTMANVSPFVFPGYILWAVPYAVVCRRGLASTLIAMPLAAYLVDDVYGLHEVAAAIFIAVVSYCGLDILRFRRAAEVRPRGETQGTT